MCFPCFPLCLSELGHELVLLSVVAVCVGQVTVTFSLGGLDGVSPHADVGEGTGRHGKGSGRGGSAPGKSQPATASCCLALLNMSQKVESRTQKKICLGIRLQLVSSEQ